MAELVVAEFELVGGFALVPGDVLENAAQQAEFKGSHLCFKSTAHTGGCGRVLGDFGRQIAGFYRASPRHTGGAFDREFEFAHIARPAIRHQVFHCRIGKFALLKAGDFLDDLLDKIMGQWGNVFAAFAQRGESQHLKAQSVIEVLAESALGDLGFEIGIGRGDHAHIDQGDGLRAAHALNFAVFDGAQDILLKFGRGIANFVEEYRAPARGFKFARACFCRAGISPFLVPEEFALQQLIRQSRAVDLDKGPIPARAAVVDGSGDEFLARAGFAYDERGPRDGRDGLGLLENASKFRAVADDPIPLAKFVSVKLVFPAQVLNFGAQLGVFSECSVHAVEFFDAEFNFVFQVKIFFDEVRRAQVQRGHRRIYGALPGQHDDGQIRHRVEHARQNFEATGFVRAKIEVENREADAVRMLFEIGQRLAGSRKCLHPARIALQALDQHVEDFDLVVGNDDFGHGSLATKGEGEMTLRAVRDGLIGWGFAMAFCHDFSEGRWNVKAIARRSHSASENKKINLV